MPFILPIVAAASAAFATVGTFIAATGFIGQALIAGGLLIASSYIMSALSPKPETDQSASTPGGVQFDRQYGNGVARQVACGIVGIAGHDVYVSTGDDANKNLQQIYVLSDYYTSGLSRLSVNGTYVTLGADRGDGFRPIASGDLANLIVVKFYDGRQTAADAVIKDNANPPDKWSVDNIGFGISYVVVAMVYDQEKNSSFPDFFFEFYGAPLYDIRKDSTAGGSGSHRWDDKSTHEYSANPMMIEYNYRRGFTVNGDLFCGMDLPPSDLPFDKFATAMNVCDETQPDGHARYECSIMLNCMTVHSDNLQSISTACGSMQIDGVAGSWPLVGTDQAAVLDITDADIISTADFRYTARQSMAQLVNSVSGNFPDPEQLWSMVGYDPQIAGSEVVIDRRTRDINIDFPQVSWYRQACQLAWIYLYENRYEARATLTLRPRFQVLEAGDWINWYSDRFASIGGVKTFMVAGTQLLSLDSDSPRNVVVQLQERDGQIYTGVTPPPIILPYPPGEPVYQSEVENFNAIAVNVIGADGREQAGIRVSWSPLVDVTITGVDVIYYPTAQPSAVIHKLVNYDQIVLTLAEGVVGSTQYTVRAKVITEPLRTTVYNAGVDVTTLDVAFDLDAATKYQVDKLLSQLNDRIANAENLIASVASNQNGRQWNNKQMAQRQMQSVTGTLTATISEVMTVATDTQGALASYEITTNAAIGAVSATVTTNSTAIATINAGLVASWSVTLNVNGHISGIKQLNDGSLSTFTISADAFLMAFPAAGAGGTARTVFTIQNVNGVATMALRGDFYADGVIQARSITVTSLSALSVNAGALTAGTLTATNGKMLIDLNNARELFSD